MFLYQNRACIFFKGYINGQATNFEIKCKVVLEGRVTIIVFTSNRSVQPLSEVNDVSSCYILSPDTL